MSNHSFLKQINKLLILKTILDKKNISRAKIARLLDLNKATVSNLTDELLIEGYISEKGYGKSKGGRKPVLLEINKNVGLIIGVDLGVNYIYAILANFVGEIIYEKKIDFSINETKENIMSILINVIDEIIQYSPKTQKGILGIGIGVPGVVEKITGTILLAPNLKWVNEPLKSILQDKFNIPVYIENEANAGALGEKWYGKWDDVSNLVFISIGIGIGAGIIIDNEIYRGVTGFAGEIGHTTINFNDNICSCGNIGCLENYASERALFEIINGYLNEGDSDKFINKDNFNQLNIQTIIELAKNGSRISRKAIIEIAEKLGIGILNFVNILNPEIIIIKSKFDELEDLFLENIKKVVYERSFITNFHKIKIESSHLKEKACAIGCVALVISDLLSLPDYKQNSVIIPTK